VDQSTDPELGDIVMVKKKKSRVGLDGLEWGAAVAGGGGGFGEVTNTRDGEKEKDEKEGKWWTIGRGRKDSKGKEKENVGRAKCAYPSPLFLWSYDSFNLI
jgi:serine/arginine repetitive matrix protein 2